MQLIQMQVLGAAGGDRFGVVGRQATPQLAALQQRGGGRSGGVAGITGEGVEPPRPAGPRPGPRRRGPY